MPSYNVGNRGGYRSKLNTPEEDRYRDFRAITDHRGNVVGYFKDRLDTTQANYSVNTPIEKFDWGFSGTAGTANTQTVLVGPTGKVLRFGLKVLI